MRGGVVETRDDRANVVQFLLKVTLREVDVVAETRERRTQLSDNQSTAFYLSRSLRLDKMTVRYK